MELEDVPIISYAELAGYADNFSENNYLCHFQFGKLYRGKIVLAEKTLYVVVKIWEDPKIYKYMHGENECRLADEIVLLSHEMFNHPGMVKLYGYCYEGGHLGTVYEFKPFDSVFNLVPKDDFTWLQRIKVALRFASLLKFLHSVKNYKPFKIRNLDCAHIVLDEDYNPKLCDFSMIIGGIFPEEPMCPHYRVLGCHGYADAGARAKGVYTEAQDVFAFGVILVNLISKRVYDVEDHRESALAIWHWAWREFARYEDSRLELQLRKFSLAHESLASDPGFDFVDGRKITLLAKECMACYGSERPTMKQVLRSLLKLRVVKKHADFFGVKELLHSSKNGI